MYPVTILGIHLPVDKFCGDHKKLTKPNKSFPNKMRSLALLLLVTNLKQFACQLIGDIYIYKFFGTGSSTFQNNVPATSANVYDPWGIFENTLGDFFICSWRGHRVLKVTKSTGLLNSIAGTTGNGYNGEGPATSSGLNYPAGIIGDTWGSIYVADEGNGRIRLLRNGTNQISTVAYGGSEGYQAGTYVKATDVYVPWQRSFQFDTVGNLYTAGGGWEYNFVMRLDKTGYVRNVAGSGGASSTGDGGPVTSATFNWLFNIFLHTNGDLYIAEWEGCAIRKANIFQSPSIVTTVVGRPGSCTTTYPENVLATTTMGGIREVVVDSRGNIYFIHSG